MSKSKSKIYTLCEKLIFDWSDRRRYLIHYTMLKSYVKLGMIVETLHNLIFLEQKPSLKSDIVFDTNERATAKNGFLKICLSL